MERNNDFCPLNGYNEEKKNKRLLSKERWFHESLNCHRFMRESSTHSNSRFFSRKMKPAVLKCNGYFWLCKNPSCPSVKSLYLTHAKDLTNTWMKFIYCAGRDTNIQLSTIKQKVHLITKRHLLKYHNFKIRNLNIDADDWICIGYRRRTNFMFVYDGNRNTVDEHWACSSTVRITHQQLV